MPVMSGRPGRRELGVSGSAERRAERLHRLHRSEAKYGLRDITVSGSDVFWGFPKVHFAVFC